MKNYTLLCLAVILMIASCTNKYEPQIDLSGEWSFAIDSLDKGISEKWYSTNLNETIMLPGSMNSNGKGNDINLKTEWTGQIVDSSFFKNDAYKKYRQLDNFKVPFWLQPLKHYQGAAWYQKKVNIPSNWKNKQVSLFLERCHWESRLWVDDIEAGICNSLGTAHQYDLTKFLSPGQHVLTICIDNRTKEIDPGINSHSISDHTQTNWNGIVGRLFLEARPLVKIQSVQVFPDIENKQIALKINISNNTERIIESEIQIQATGASTPKNQRQKVELAVGDNQLSIDYPMGDDVKLWDEFNPNIYQLKAVFGTEESSLIDSLSTTFGMRSFTANGRQLEINGRPVFLRGTLECAIFPKTGYPATDETEWSRIFSVCQEHGLNHMRFHSWCPPEAAFTAADKAGFYLQVECSSWANQSTTIGDGKPFDQYLYEESQRMINSYGNHPSFCMMAYGNEPGGRNQNTFLTEFVGFWKERDNRRIYTSGAGWPNLEINDYMSDSEPRIQHWGQGLKSIINAESPKTNYDFSTYINQFPQPMVSHEIGQWCVYPNFKEIQKYDGVMRARNFEIFQETLKENQMEQLADSFLLASGKLQALCYKADIEAALRTPQMGGFQLLDLHDFPGQGTALVGVLDPFWEEKGYISPAEYKRFCNSTVPLARLKKRVFTNTESFEAAIEIAHYGESPITKCTPEWRILSNKGQTIQSGKLPQTDIQLGNGQQLGSISLPLTSLVKPEKYILEVSVDKYINSWDFWVYPAKKEDISGDQEILVVQKINQQVIDFLETGGTVLLNLKKGTLSPEMGGNIQIGFSSIFWNTAWTHGQAPHTLGILCNPNHPALAEFPTEYHSNWQWWDAMSHSGAINLSSFPSEIKPIVRVVDDWFTNRPLALLIEAKVGKGRILVSGIDLTSELTKRPEAQQLLYSLKKYISSKQFNPAIELTTEDISKI